MPKRSSNIPRGVRRLFRLPPSRDALLRDLDEEWTFHVQMRAEELRAEGMSAAEAEAEALRRFGDGDEFRDYAARRAERKARRIRVAEWCREWWQDVRFARRQFQKAPAFTAIAVLTLALGIGANSAIFSVVHHLILAPLPYPNGNRIVTPMAEDMRGLPGSVDGAVVRAWQLHGTSVAEVAIAGEEIFSVRPDGTIDSLSNAAITSNFFKVLGVRPVRGRTFTLDEERSQNVAMIGYGLWQRDYAGRDDAIGRTIELEGKPYRIVGVTPPGLEIPMLSAWGRTRPSVTFPPPQVWIPLSREDPARDGGGPPSVFALLRDGVSPERASQELQAIAASVAAERPNRATGADASGHVQRVRAMRAQDFLDPREAHGVRVLFVAVGALLLIACANVANLLLARAWTRRREFAVRVALGAGRARLARQVLTESLLLAVGGGVLGVVVAWQMLKVIVALRPPSLEYLVDVHVETPVLLWSAAISVATGILFGCAPALLAGSRTIGDMLRMETRAGSATGASRRARSALVVLEIAMSLVLLVSAGLLVRSFVALQRMPLGFEPRGLVFDDVLIGPRNRDRKPIIRAEIMQRLRALPGVTEVSMGMIPGKGFLGPGLEGEIDRGGRTVRTQAAVDFISSDFFRTARMSVVEGRLPDTAAVNAAWPANGLPLSSEVVVNRGLANRLWPNGHAVGSRIRHPSAPNGKRPSDPWSTVVGVVDDIHMAGMSGDTRTLQLYSVVPPNLGEVPFLVRTTLSGEALAPIVKRTIVDVDRGLLVREPLSGEQYLRDSLAPTRFAMALLAAFAVVALALSAIGLYGIIAYNVGQRTREIGIRVALGAEPGAITRLVVSGGVRLVAAGVAIGIVAAAAATRALASLLYAVTPADPPTFIAISILVGGIAVIASFVPVRRALRIDPTEALRAD